MQGERSARSRFGDLPGLAAVTATYVYFLIWAQFGWLSRMRQSGLDAGDIRMAMAAMGVAGFAAGFAASRLPAKRRTIATGLAGCALAALGSLAAGSLSAFVMASAAVGATTAIATVGLASALPALVGPRRRGLAVGAATGLAYLICNLPVLFEAEPTRQAGSAAALCLFAAAGLGLRRDRTGPPQPLPFPPPERSFRGPGWAAVVASFLALVWLDSAAFAIIQESSTLRQLTWAAGNVKLILGAIHLVAALIAGWVIDRGGLLRLPIPAYGALALAAAALGRVESGLAVGALYAAGVSLYSVALVLAPAARLDPASSSPGLRAAQLFGIAGWLGSAAGVGMAQDLHHIPRLFLVAAGTLLGAATLFGAGARQRRLALRALPAIAVALLGGLVHLLAADADAAPTSDRRPQEENRSIARGRAVYVAEGCIHCHSQFVRPGSRDETLWGPAHPLDRQERPPLVGNRRQGPDLAEVGARRNPVWNRLHLLDPRALTPASRMPSYAHLFAPGERRGDDLIEYLASLGSSDAPARSKLLESVESRPEAPPAASGDRRFGELCAPCHGDRGRGDGALSTHFSRPALDLTKPVFNHVPDRDPARLARLIRWGVPGTAMAGHETLSGEEIGELTASVLELASRPATEPLPREGP